MPTIRDEYTESFVALWRTFLDADFPDFGLDPSSNEDSWESKGPTETLDEVWLQRNESEEPGPRFKEILSRVRSWIRGAEQSALNDRRVAQVLFDRCALDTDLAGWREFSAGEREQTIDRLLRTIAGLSTAIRNARPRGDGESEFRIDWGTDADGQGYWESEGSSRAFSLLALVNDVVRLHGQFDQEAKTIARNVTQGLRTGDLVLPLLKPDPRSSEQTTRLSYIMRGDADEQGLLLPEVESAIQDEMVLWQNAPSIARVFSEALIIAAHENVERPELKWADVKAQVTVADEPESMSITELCEVLQQDMALPLESACTFLGAPLAVISQTTKDSQLKRRAKSSLAVLQQLIK